MKAKKIMAGTLAAAMTVGGGALPISTIASVMTASAASTTATDKAVTDVLETLKNASFSYGVIADDYTADASTGVKADELLKAVKKAIDPTGKNTAEVAKYTVSDAKYVPASLDKAASVTYKVTYTDGDDSTTSETISTNLNLTPAQKVAAAQTLVTEASIAGFEATNENATNENIAAAIAKAIAKTGANLNAKTVDLDIVNATKEKAGSIKTKKDKTIQITATDGKDIANADITLNIEIAKLRSSQDDVNEAVKILKEKFAAYEEGKAAFGKDDTDATIEAMAEGWIKEKGLADKVTLNWSPAGEAGKWYTPATESDKGSFGIAVTVSSTDTKVSEQVIIKKFDIDKLKDNQTKANNVANALKTVLGADYTLPSTANENDLNKIIKETLDKAVAGGTLAAADLVGVSYNWGNNNADLKVTDGKFQHDGSITGKLNIVCGGKTAEVALGTITLKNSAKENVNAAKKIAEEVIKAYKFEGATDANTVANAVVDAIKAAKVAADGTYTTDDRITTTVGSTPVTIEVVDKSITPAQDTDGKFTAKLKFTASASTFDKATFNYTDEAYEDTLDVNAVVPLSQDQKIENAKKALKKLAGDFKPSNKTTQADILAAANEAIKNTGLTAAADAGALKLTPADYGKTGNAAITVYLQNADGRNVAVYTFDLTIEALLQEDKAIEEAAKEADKALAGFVATKDTTVTDVVNVVKKAVAPYDYANVAVDPTSTNITIVAPTKTAKGSITGTIKLTTSSAAVSKEIKVNLSVPALTMTDAEKLEAAKTLLDETLAKFKTSNATKEADLSKAITEAFAKSDNLKNVTNSIAAFNNKNATKEADGKITAVVTLEVNGSKETYSVDLKIAQLDKTDAEKVDEIANAVTAALAAYQKNTATTLNATKQDEFTAMVEKAVTDLGYKLGTDAKLTISDFKVLPSSVANKGAIKGSIEIMRGLSYKQVLINISIDQLPTDEKKIADATAAAKEAIAAVKPSNETTADSILDAVKAAIVKAGVDVAADWSADAPFAIKKATEAEDGSVTGSIVLKSGDKTETVAVNLPIAKLVLTDAEKAENAKKLVEDALKNFTATNDTIESEVSAAITVALKDTAATATIANFNVLKSTVDAEGKVTGTVTIKVGENGTATIELALPIAKIEAPTVAGVVLNKTYTNSTSAIRIKWDAAEGVDGYEVYKNGTLAGNVQAGEFLATGLAAGTTYKFTVKAYKTVDGVKYYSDESEALAACTKPKATTITGFVSRATKTVKVAWHSVTGPTSYQVQISADKTFKTGVKNAYVSYKSERSYTTKVSKSKTTYYVRVRACKRSGGNVYRSAWSPVKTVKTK